MTRMTDADTPARPGNGTTVVLDVCGLHWASEPSVANSVLSRRPGVLEVTVNLVAQTVTVRFDPAATSVAQLRAWLQECGYHCTGQSVPSHVREPKRPGPPGGAGPVVVRILARGQVGHRASGGPAAAARRELGTRRGAVGHEHLPAGVVDRFVGGRVLSGEPAVHLAGRRVAELIVVGVRVVAFVRRVCAGRDGLGAHGLGAPRRRDLERHDALEVALEGQVVDGVPRGRAWRCRGGAEPSEREWCPRQESNPRRFTSTVSVPVPSLPTTSETTLGTFAERSHSTWRWRRWSGRPGLHR